jgi:haloacetate dehalogenase
VLVHWGAEEESMSDGPLHVWRRWAEAVEGGPLRSGHFVPEEAPEELVASLGGFLQAGLWQTASTLLPSGSSTKAP